MIGRAIVYLIAMCGAAMSAMPAPALAEDANTMELAIKATYLLKLQSFVVWPDDAFSSSSSPFNLCVVGGWPFGELLDRVVAGQYFGTRAISVLRSPTAAPDAHCHIMYLVAGGPQPVAQGLEAVRGTPVLTVTDSAIDPISKGIVNFVIRDNHVRLEIDEAAAGRNRLAISSKLLNIAISVTPKS